MATVWTISVGNGLLLACYFIPTWTFAIWSIIESPIRGLFERPNIATAIFFSDSLHLTAVGVARLAWLMALGKVLVVAFFVAFAVLALRAILTRRDETREPLVIALGLGSLVSGIALFCAAMTGETQALQLHATESLMLIGATVVMLIEDESRTASRARPSAPSLSEASALPNAA
ncbi:MAG: hypothetical protein EPO23_09510 [Xanthobacteraceae bacterium]|nr:MAG: hypothetical protein EPO23_09510 [Xanthobacteraceae bacterium]